MMLHLLATLRWGLGLVGLLWLAQVQAGTAVSRVDITQLPGGALSLTRHLTYLEDRSAQLSLEQVLQPARAEAFAPAPKPGGAALGFSYTASAIWLRLALNNPTDQALPRILELSYALLGEVDLYQPEGQAPGGFAHTAVGYARPFSARAHPGRYTVLPLTLPAHSSQVLYLRVASANSLVVPATLWEPDAYTSHVRQDYLVQGLYFGIVIAILAYNLMLFLALRDISYLLYVGFGACVALALAAFSGLGTEFFWHDQGAWAMMGTNVPAALAGVAILLFTRRVLSTARAMPRLDRVVQLFVALNLLAVPLLVLWFRAVAPAFVVFNALTALLTLVCGVVGIARRQRSAGYFVAAFTIVLLAVVLAHLRNLGILPSNWVTSDGTQIGSAIEMLLLSFALADRYNTMRRERLEAQVQALRTQQEMVGALKAAEQELEARVAERTTALQHLNHKLEAMSATDGLTGIANRRHFDDSLAREWSRALRQQQCLSLGLLDVDWFKKYNDHYGHLAGDACLRAVAQVLARTICRSGDVVARYGGEEFVFIAPALHAADALALAQRARDALQALALPHALSDFGCVTASIGVATVWPGEGQDPQALLQAADAALYRAKEQGRNQVVPAVVTV